MRSCFISGILLAVVLSLPSIAGAANEPQQKLPTAPLVIGDKKLVAEIADDPAEKQTGMMFRKTMPEGEAMVFVFDAPQRASFWMRNTLIPLSVAYVNRAGTILEIHDMKPRDETPVESKFDTISYAIEVPQGWFIKNAILPGSRVQGLPATEKTP